MISVLCVCPGSNYYKIPGLDLWDRRRDVFNFVNFRNRVIAHPPCAQWSKLRSFAKADQKEKELAWYCYQCIIDAGVGVFEHPAGSSFFRHAGIRPTHSVNQKWFGFPAEKRTWLWFHNCKPGMYPVTFDLARSSVEGMTGEARSRMPLSMCKWLVDAVHSAS